MASICVCERVSWLFIDVGVSIPPWTVSSLRRVSLISIRYLAKHEPVSEPKCKPVGIAPYRSYLDFLQGWIVTRKCKPNTFILPEVIFLTERKLEHWGFICLGWSQYVRFSLKAKKGCKQFPRVSSDVGILTQAK